MKYYRCIRDLFHYKYNGNVYNFRMGQVVPYTPMVQNNLLNFEPFGNDFHVEGSKKDVLVIVESTKEEEVVTPEVVPEIIPEVVEVVSEPKVKVTRQKKSKPIEKEVEVEIEVTEEAPAPKKRTRTKKTEVLDAKV